MFRKVLVNDARTQPASSTCADQLQQSPTALKSFGNEKKEGRRERCQQLRDGKRSCQLFTAGACNWVHTHQHQRRNETRSHKIHRCEVRCRSIIIETINDQGKRSDNSLVRAPKAASERSEPQNPLHSGEFCDSAPADPTPTTLSWRAVLTRIQRAHAASTRQQSANLPLLQNPTGLFEENLRVFNCRPLSATAGDQRFLLLDHSVDLLPRHSCEPFSWRLVVRRNVVGSVNVDIDACRFLHDTPPFQSALSSSPRTTRFSHSLYPHRRAWIVVHSEQEAPARSCGKPVAVVRA